MPNKSKMSSKGEGSRVGGAMQHQTKSTGDAQNVHCGPTSWADLPILSDVFDLLENPRDLAACASVCRTWRDEASVDSRWRKAWSSNVSDQGLWRWAKADGGYREQLRAKALVRKGDCIASTFPLSRRDGPVSEVLLLDCAPEPRIVTVQHRRPAPHVVRLQGATIKVWTAATLTSQKPLFTLHDVIKHLQMEDGRLFLWHIADDAIITVRCHPEAPEAEAAECRRWTEHPSLVASVLDPVALTLTPVPLDSAFGRGAAPHEWMDMCSGAVASASVVLTQHRVSVRLLDIATGECFKESQCAMPAMPGDAVPPMHEDTAVMLMSRNSDTEYQVIAAAALFDCRVFRWRLRDEWLTPAARAKASERQRRRREAAQAAQQQQQQRQQQGDEAGSVSGGFINGGGEQPFVGHQAAGGNNDLGQGVAQDNMHDAVYTEAEESGEFVLHHIFTTPDAEPIVDLSISTAAHRIYVLGMENLFILGEDGRPQMTCSMVQWRGVHSSVAEMGPYDVGAFSWPLPNSTRAAFYLDVTNSLFVADFKPPMPWCPPGSSNEQPRYPISDLHIGWDVQQGDFRTFRVQSHTDLRPSPRVSPATTFTGRVTRPSDNEQVVVEYIQSGDVLFTGADACCPTTASLLSAEKAAGTYLQGLGPAAVGRGGSSRSGPVITRQGNGGGSRAAVAPRALVCIDVATGRRFKAVPVEGAIEAVHSAGHYAVMAVAPLQSYPEGLNGSLVVLDFSQEGFGLSEAQRAQQAQAQRGHRRQTATSTAWESRGAGGSVTGAGEVEAEPEAAMQAGRVGTGRGKRKKRPHSSQHLS